jgi:aminoglycoside phosphotransferase (APT) family kinase protein
VSAVETGALSPAKVAESLREALIAGDFSALGDLYADDVVFDANLQGGRSRVAGVEAVIELLGSLFGGPGRLVEWSPGLHRSGIALWFERVSDGGTAVRQRHYLHLRDGRIGRHWAYAAPPRTAAAGARDGGLLLDTRLISGLGEVAEHEPVVSTGWSGNVLERLALADGRRLVAKRIVPGTNWIDRHTKDEGREALLFTSGVLGRMPQAIDHAVVAAERDGDAWWVVMRDVSASLLPDDKRPSREEHRRILEAANLMWEEFWDEQVPHLCTLHDCFGLFSPAIAEAEHDGLDLLPKQYEVFWEAFAEAVDRDVAEAVLALVEDPAPLVAELEDRGTTLIHADIRDEQIGLDGHRLILLDWGRASQGHPVVDFFWSICHNAWRIDATHDELVEDFRHARGERDDPRALELGVIAGLVMYGWVFGHSAAYHPDPAERDWARHELAWWVPRARRALETWSPV